MTRLAGIYGEPFAEQVAAFRLRLGTLIPTAKWDDIKRAEHDRGFMVAGAIKADLLADLGAAVDKAIATGTSLEEFRRDFRAIVAKHGWHGWAGEGTKGGEAWRTRVIYKTNLATTYAAGRMAQLVEAGFTLWVYRHGASLEPREQHLAWDGLILPPDHPFWATHAPPNGWGCSCYVLGARSIRGAVRLGGKPDLKLPDNWQAQDPRTGAPVGIDKGWDYAPGRSVAETVSVMAEKLRTLPATTGSDFVASWPDPLRASWAESFADFVDQTLGGPAKGKTTIVGALHPKWTEAAKREGIIPATAEIAVTDKNILHTFRDSKSAPLNIGWFKSLPQHLQHPEAVLLDTTQDQPAFLLILKAPEGGQRIVVKINYHIKKVGLTNVVTSGRPIDDAILGSMRGMLVKPQSGKKGYILIEGSL